MFCSGGGGGENNFVTHRKALRVDRFAQYVFKNIKQTECNTPVDTYVERVSGNGWEKFPITAIVGQELLNAE